MDGRKKGCPKCAAKKMCQRCRKALNDKAKIVEPDHQVASAKPQEGEPTPKEPAVQQVKAKKPKGKNSKKKNQR